MNKDSHLIFEQYLKESPPVYGGDEEPGYDFAADMTGDELNMLTGPKKDKHGHARHPKDAPPENEGEISQDTMRRIAEIARDIWKATIDDSNRKDDYGRPYADFETVARFAGSEKVRAMGQKQRGDLPGIPGAHPSKWAVRIIANAMVRLGYLTTDRKRAKYQAKKELPEPQELVDDIVPAIEDEVELTTPEVQADPGGWLDKMKSGLGL